MRWPGRAAALACWLLVGVAYLRQLVMAAGPHQLRVKGSQPSRQRQLGAPRQLRDIAGFGQLNTKVLSAVRLLRTKHRRHARRRTDATAVA